ncbi:hypothetical protein PL8927_540012 [Planktothrix serta PCC 8927]|uniref:DUF5648 domain-containing protein n=1 Tax=Planktothrix serta PCC 8927 TaxID=671068 RepID=A0A7Z9BP67_9CYAN|nr:hypothetical protein [Planktothrix serta]VXD16231.1 hypothetical protein PL8927_540012 [Planktothrix serta PCC 8927]
MAGNRYTGRLLTAGVTETINVPASDITPPVNQPLRVTAYPIVAGPGAPQTLDIQFTPSANVAGFPSGVKVDDSFQVGGAESLNFNTGFPLNTGLTLNVTGFPPTTGNYLIEVDSEVPNNFSFQSDARGVTDFTQAGFVGRSDLDDYYQIVVDQRPVEITLSGLKDDAKMELYQLQNGNPIFITSSDNTGNINEVIRDSLTGGTYLIRVTTEGKVTTDITNITDGGGASTPYNLSVTRNSGGDLGTQTNVERFLNTQISGHFYTIDPLEIQQATTNPILRKEFPPFSSSGTFTAQRYKNINNGAYFYATNAGDVASVQALQAWQLDDATAFQVYPINDLTRPANAIPVERFYNTILDGHFYSTNSADSAIARSIGFISEGTGFYALPAI